MRRRETKSIPAALAAVCLAAGPPAGIAAATSSGPSSPPERRIATLLTERALAEHPNPVVLDFLLAGGGAHLPESTRREAIEQLTAGLRERTLVSPFGALEALGGPGGMLSPGAAMKDAMKRQLAPGNLLRGALKAPRSGAEQQHAQARAQESMRSALVDPWARGVAAATSLARAGFAADAAEFYRRCLASPSVAGVASAAGGQEISAWSRWVLARCESGLAALGVELAGPIFAELADEGRPDFGGAFDGLAAMARAFGEDAGPPRMEPMPAIQAAGFSGLAALLAAGELTPAQRRGLADAALEILERPKRKLDDRVAEAAAATLGAAADPRARKALERLARRDERFPRGSWAAREALAAGYADQESLRWLESNLRGGSSEHAWQAFEVLLELDRPRAWEWAARQLARDSVPMDETDWRGLIAERLAYANDARSLEVLRGADRPGAQDENFQQALVSTALFQRGERRRLSELAAAAERDDWDLGRRAIGQWWRLVKPILKAAAMAAAGLPVDQESARRLVTDFAFGALDAHRDQERREATAARRLRHRIATALADWDDPAAVPLISRLLESDEDSTRLAAARALLAQTSDAALPVILQASTLDYGAERGESRNPEIHAALLVHAGERFGSHPRFAARLAATGPLATPSVRFVAAALAGLAAAGDQAASR